MSMDKTTAIYSVGGGKGGIGKSFIVANLGVLFAKQGKRTLLIDLDLGGSNLHTFLGVEAPKTELSDFLNKNIKDLGRVAVPTNIPNLSIITSINCSIESANLIHTQKLKIIRAIKSLHYDCILLDLGAGTSFNTLDFFLTSDEGIFICTPQPTSIENTFQFMKAVYYRILKQVLKQDAFRKIIASLSKVSDDNHIKLHDLIEYTIGYDPKKGRLLKEMLERFQFRFIMNEYRKQIDPKLGNKIERVYNRHFYSRFQFLGNIHFDDRVYDSVLSKNVFMKKYPYTSTATDLQDIAGKLMDVIQEPISESRYLP